MLRSDLNRHRAVVRKIDHEILSRAALLLSKHPGPSAESKTKRPEKNATWYGCWVNFSIGEEGEGVNGNDAVMSSSPSDRKSVV